MARVLTAIEARLRARGKVGIRWLIRLIWLVIAGVALFVLVGPVINAPLDLDDVLASADIDEVDWVARDVNLDYTVTRDADGHFVAEVRETFTAHFLNDASASEIERAVVTEFQGRDVRFELHSATVDGEDAQVRITRTPAMTTIGVGLADTGETAGEAAGEAAGGAEGTAEAGGTRDTGGAGADVLSGQHEIVLSYELHNLVTEKIDTATDRMIDEWSWPLFARWPQATVGIEASFTFEKSLDDALIRAPSAYIGWLLVSGSERLEPEETTAEWVRYSFCNDQNLPPNADFWITAEFAPGTFELPPTTSLFWVQRWGPLLPLAVLGVMLLFALAARRVVWADSAGRPWYTARSEPPNDLPPELAARLLRKPWHAELVDALRARPRRRHRVDPSLDPAVRSGYVDDTRGGAQARRERWLRHVAEAGRRAGRLGSLPAVMGQRTRWSTTHDPILERGLRWVPDSYVRDSFVLAPIAITLLQWGLLRQLSHQTILAAIWLPAMFVLVSTALAVATIVAVSAPRPLTPDGAIMRQHLKGIDVYARATRLLERGPVDDALLPYAVLFERPRRAGDAVTELAAREAGDRHLARNWRTARFISAPAIVALTAALACLAGAIVWVSVAPPPYAHTNDHITRFDDLPGTHNTQVTGFEIAAELTRDATGHARLDVTERHTVEFAASGGYVPQFAREWPASRLGQDLGIEQVTMRIDGALVPTREGQVATARSHYVVSQLETVLSGEHEIEVTYTLASPIVAARSVPAGLTDAVSPDHASADPATADPANTATEQLRWTAWYHFWEDEYYVNPRNAFDGRAPVRPIRLEFTLAPELVDAVQQGGWIDGDYQRANVPGESGNWFDTWVYEEYTSLGDFDAGLRYDLRIGSVTTRPDGALTAVIDIDEVQSRQVELHTSDEADHAPWAVDPAVNAQLTGFELDLRSDVGVRLDFAPGTFAGVEPRELDAHLRAYHAPYLALLALAGLVTVASAGVMVAAVRLRGAGRSASASLRAIAYLAIPLAALAQCVLFFWAIGPMPGTDGRIPAAVTLGGVMLLAVAAEMIVTAFAGKRRLQLRPRAAAPGHSG